MTKEELIERIKAEAILIETDTIDISNIKNNLKQYTSIKNEEAMIMFAEKFNMILFDRIEKISKDRLHIQIYPFTSPKTLSEWCGQRKNVMGVAWICNASGSIETYFMDESGVFYDHTEQKIAQNEDEFFNFILNVEFDYHVKILPQTIELLNKAGWYQGRKIDASQYIMKFHQEGFELSGPQVDFIQEFGGISGNDINNDEFEVYIDPKYCRYEKSKPLIPSDPSSYNPLNIISNNENIEFLLIGEIGNHGIRLWLSTDGRLFSDQGIQLGRTIMEGWQSILL